MPAYEYLCDQCGAHFEQRQKMSDPALDTCPTCGGAAHRLISGGAGAITKGAAAPMPACASGGPCCAGSGGCGEGFCQN